MSPHNSQHAVIPNSNTPPRIKFSGGRLSILPVLLLLSLLALSPLAAPVRVDALTQDVDGVYLIATPADLREFRDRVNSEELTSADARLTADIDLSVDGTPEEWTPIGDGHNGTDDQIGLPNYRGAFDGAGHTVGGYKITTLPQKTVGVGFFGHIGVDGSVTGLTVSGKIDMPAGSGRRAGGKGGEHRQGQNQRRQPCKRSNHVQPTFPSGRIAPDPFFILDGPGAAKVPGFHSGER